MSTNLVFVQKLHRIGTSFVQIFWPVFVSKQIQDILPHSALPCNTQTVEQGLNSVKTRVDSLTALTLVGAFIAAVQAQMIAFTYSQNSTRLQVATNGLSFAGLALDIIGTSLGLLDSVKLQQCLIQLQRLQRNVERNVEIKQKIFDLETILQPGPGSGSHAEPKRVQRELANQLEQENETNLLFSVYFSDALFPAARSTPARMTGTLPLIALSLGILCFLAALCCFVHETQPRVVFYMTLFSMVGSVIGFWLTARLGQTDSDLKRLTSSGPYVSMKERIAQLRA